MTLLITIIPGCPAARINSDLHTNFERYKTYSWTKIETSNSLWDARVKAAVDWELAAKGWTQVPSGGDVLVAAHLTTQTETETVYSGFGGGRGGGRTTTKYLYTYKAGTLLVDMSDSNTRNMLWRGVSSDTLAGDPEKNTKKLHKAVQKMFRQFPPKFEVEQEHVSEQRASRFPRTVNVDEELVLNKS